MATTAERMMSLFEGYSDAHGTYSSTEKNNAKGGKLEIKKTARTIREPVTVELWEQHLSGDRPLGIIPIRNDHTCMWGCIDVDRYDIDLGDTVRQLKKMSLPLTVCRTKSGGAHAFIFFREPFSAEETRALLRKMAATMGWGDCEIFPKQNQILSDRGDLGNWLNMPYFAGDKTDRYAVKETDAAYSVGEFLAHAEASRVLGEESVDVPEPKDESLDDGPPCLQHLAAMGVPDGTRNNTLFAMGIFCKKKFGSRWKEMLEQYNRDYMTPPLDASEVVETIKNLERKDYNYSCKDQPLVSYCNSTLCRMRKYGVGGGGLYPEVSGLSKLETEPPLWFMDIEDQRIELTTRQLQNYKEFQAVCMETLTCFFMPMKAETWAALVGDAMQNAIILEAPPEMSISGHFMELVEDFCMNRHRGETQEDLFLGKPWYDEESRRHYFRLKDLSSFLEREGFKYANWGRNKIGREVERIGGKHFFNIKSKGVNVFWVPDTFTAVPELSLPKSEETPI